MLQMPGQVFETCGRINTFYIIRQHVSNTRPDICNMRPSVLVPGREFQISSRVFQTMRPSVLVPGRVFQISGQVFKTQTQTQTQMTKSATADVGCCGNILYIKNFMVRAHEMNSVVIIFFSV